MSYPIDTIEGFGDTVSTGIDVLFPGLAILRALKTPSVLGGSEAGRDALRLFHKVAGPSEYTPIVAGVLLAGAVVATAVVLKKRRKGT